MVRLVIPYLMLHEINFSTPKPSEYVNLNPHNAPVVFVASRRVLLELVYSFKQFFIKCFKSVHGHKRHTNRN